jgi:CP family cyanate transporter-like MFS transporter
MNLRAPIAAVGPVLDDLRADLGLSTSVAGLLTTLPVLCFGVAAILATKMARRIGEEMGIVVALVVLVAGTAIRLEPSVGALFLGTVVAGAGIAFGNVLTPSVIKRYYANPGTMMGVFAMVLTCGAALVAGLTVPLEHLFDSWELAIASWGLLGLAAIVLWLPVVRAARRVPPAIDPARVRLRGDRVAWLLTGLFATQSMMFYSDLAWVPDILRASGSSDAHAGAMLSVALLMGGPGAFAASYLAGRTRDQRVLAVALAASAAVGMAGLLVAATTATVVWMCFIGIGQGGLFSLSLALIVLRSTNNAQATSLSGMVQGTGSVLAAAGPFVLGFLHDLSGGWSVPLVAMLVLIGVMALCGLAAGRPRMVGHDAAHQALEAAG